MTGTARFLLPAVVVLGLAGPLAAQDKAPAAPPAADAAGDALLERYRALLGELFPRSVTQVMYSKEYRRPGVLGQRTINTVSDARDYFLLAYPNPGIGHSYFPPAPDPKKPAEPVPGGALGGFAADCVLPHRIKGGGPEAEVLARAAVALAARLGEVDGGDGADGPAGRLLRDMVRRDGWQVLAGAAKLAAFLPGADREWSQALLKVAVPTEAELAAWSQSGLEKELLEAGANHPEVAGLARGLERMYQVPEADLLHFEHTHAFGGASLFRVYIDAPGWSREQVAESFEKVRAAQLKKTGFERDLIPEFPAGTKTYLVRSLLLPVSVEGRGVVTVVESPLIEEVLIREFVKQHPWEGPDLAMSDFVGVKYHQFKLSRGLYLEGGGRNYLRELEEDEPVIYGFRSDAPDPGRGGYMALTMRANCTDCHASESYGWPTIRSLMSSYRTERHQILNDLFVLSPMGQRRWKVRHYSPEEIDQSIRQLASEEAAR